MRVYIYGLKCYTLGFQWLTYTNGVGVENNTCLYFLVAFAVYIDVRLH